MFVCLLILKKIFFKNVFILVINILLVTIFSNYSCCFYNVSLYYQLICFLNTKSNFILIYSIIILFYLNKYKHCDNGGTNYIHLLLMFICCYIITHNDVFYKNSNNGSYYLNWLLNNKSQLNINLLNGVLLIHPIILYIFYSYVIYKTITKFNSIYMRFFKKCLG